jgi:hypothetical protein
LDQKGISRREEVADARQPLLGLKQMEASISWPLPGEAQAWEREMTSLDRPGVPTPPPTYVCGEIFKIYKI